MTWAAIGAATVTAIGNDINDPGSVQGSVPAPAPMGMPPGLLGGDSMKTLSAPTQTPIADIAGLAQSASQSDPALAMPMEGPPQPYIDANQYGKPGGPSGPPQTETPQSGFGDKLGGFFGNIDNTLQSPSKTIGLGLLGNIDPRLGYAGLLASGFFGGKKGGT